jgi:hypothetical protein
MSCHLHDFPHWLERPKEVLGFIVQRCVHDAGGHGVEADTFFCVLDCQAPSDCVQAPLRNHRNRGLFAGEGLIDKRRRYGHNVARFLFQHLFHT